MNRNILGIFSKVFASSADSSQRREFGSNPDGDPADDFEQGFQEDYSTPESGLYPRRKEFNDILAKLTAIAVDLNKYGILPWDTNLTYEEGAHVLGSDFVLYKALEQNSAINPTTVPTPAEWEKFTGGLKQTYVVSEPPDIGDLRLFDPNNASIEEICAVIATLIKDLS
jgi:hypothetical protein